MRMVSEHLCFFCFLFFFCFPLYHGKHLPQLFLSQPSSMTTNQGEHVRLQCRVANLAGSCQWLKDGFGLGADPQMPDFPRYLMGDAASLPGHCDLTIDPVLASDEGVYQCQVSPGQGSQGLLSLPAKLS